MADKSDGEELQNQIAAVTQPAGPGLSPDRSGEHRYLVVFDQESCSVFPLPHTGEVVIGRSDEVGLCLKTSSVSRRHAKIIMANGEARISDLGSQNGTHVNGELIAGSRLLSCSDTISICDATLVFHSSGQPSGARPVHELTAFCQRIEEEIDRAQRYDRPFVLAAVNLGVGSIDRPRVSEAACSRLRLVDAAGWGGPDQILLLLPETIGAEATSVVTQIREALSPLAPNAKAGLASCPADGCDVATLLASARAAAAAAAMGSLALADETFTTVAVGGDTVLIADAAMVRLYDLIEKLAASDLTILVHGETGVGKELVAAALHHRSRRRQRPLVTLNCAAVQENLFESELFGHEKGAFSGAIARKPGLLETAGGGTVFLDEIGELSMSTQAKLLRVLETKRFTRLGDVREREIDVRIVAATNRNLEQEVRSGAFRKDLFFRVCGATVWLPPLRDRLRELPILARHFLDRACANAQRGPMALSTGAIQSLVRYGWPGNVRELKNLMEYLAATVTEPVIEPWHLSEKIGTKPAEPSIPADEEAAPSVERSALGGFPRIDDEIRKLEKAHMMAALAATRGNQTQAAALIGMPLRTFVAKLKSFSQPREGRSPDSPASRPAPRKRR
jgi:DNA-binding NtrC family response regulator